MAERWHNGPTESITTPLPPHTGRGQGEMGVLVFGWEYMIQGGQISEDWKVCVGFGKSWPS